MTPKDEQIQRIRVEIAAPNEGPRKDPMQMVKELVERQVAEILATREAFIFEPFHRSKKVSDEIRRLQTIPEWHKWSRYFEVWGCLICTSRESRHGGCGMCEKCYPRIQMRLKKIIRTHRGRYEEGQYDHAIQDQEDLAQQALSGEVKALPPLPIVEPEKKYYTRKEACAAAGIDPKTLGIWLANGDVQQPEKRPGPHRWLWSEFEVEELKLIKVRNRSLHNSKAALGRWKKPNSQTENQK